MKRDAPRKELKTLAGQEAQSSHCPPVWDGGLCLLDGMENGWVETSKADTALCFV